MSEYRIALPYSREASAELAALRDEVKAGAQICSHLTDQKNDLEATIHNLQKTRIEDGLRIARLEKENAALKDKGR